MKPNISISGFDHDLDLPVRIPADLLQQVFKTDISRDALGVLIDAIEVFSSEEPPLRLFPAATLRFRAQTLFGQSALERFEVALAELTDKGFLLVSPIEDENYILPGTPQGRELAFAIAEKQISPAEVTSLEENTKKERPGIFKLYEDNIGPLTPMLAEILLQDQAEYPYEWIENAVREAVLNNARSWKYVQAILYNWKKKGRKGSTEKDSSDLSEFRKLYQEHKRGKRE